MHFWELVLNYSNKMLFPGIIKAFDSNTQHLIFQRPEKTEKSGFLGRIIRCPARDEHGSLCQQPDRPAIAAGRVVPVQHAARPQYSVLAGDE